MMGLCLQFSRRVKLLRINNTLYTPKTPKRKSGEKTLNCYILCMSDTIIFTTCDVQKTEFQRTQKPFYLSLTFKFLRYDTDFGGSKLFGRGMKIPNSVTWLNWVMFDSKIIIYVKF